MTYLRSGIFLAPFHNHDGEPDARRWSATWNCCSISTG